MGAVAGLIAAAKAEVPEAVGTVLVVLCATACGLTSAPLVGEFLVASMTNLDFDAGSRLAQGDVPQLKIDLAVGVVLYLFAIVPGRPSSPRWPHPMTSTSRESTRPRCAAQSTRGRLRRNGLCSSAWAAALA